jgi:hypothetical protein
VQVVEEREDKFEVDPDWVMPQLMSLVPDGGRLDREVRRLDNTYFDTAGAVAAVVWGHPAASRRRMTEPPLPAAAKTCVWRCRSACRPRRFAGVPLAVHQPILDEQRFPSKGCAASFGAQAPPDRSSCPRTCTPRLGRTASPCWKPRATMDVGETTDQLRTNTAELTARQRSAMDTSERWFTLGQP